MVRFLNMSSTIGRIALFCQIGALLCVLTPFGYTASRRDVHRELTKLLSLSPFKDMNVGIKVTSLETNDILFDYHGDLLLKPASNVKLVTTLAALKYLGADYEFKTKVYTDGTIQKGVLQGNLYVKGFGDPEFVSEELWYLVNDLKRNGFQTITGNLVLDDSFFDTVRTVQNGSNHEGERAYDAPLGALSVNFNTTAIYVRPNTKVGLKARVIVDPTNSYIKVINKAKTDSATKSLSLVVTRIEGKNQDTIMVTGGIPINYPEKRYYRNITNPLLYAATLFRRFMKEQGLSIQGKNQFGVVPEKAQEILVHTSKPLRWIVSDLNKISNNFIAEQMLKTMAAELNKSPGTTDKGIDILGNFLKEVGVKTPYQLVNGSGLSPQNKMSAAQLVDVLKYGYQYFEIFPEYMASMGIVGVDGTVEKRLQGTIAQGKVRVKTGSLTGVSSLSGYLSTVKNELLAFSILVNDSQDRVGDMQGLQDKILLTLCGLEN
ncbi:MAG: D-alanyl-D-alanine carboxypeptidase/D-alanyl-D-alanine-endopeptidase [Deltaproteobacteria bacterium GWA2_38_16]|nr:MAG: D-alanyl-D-alanine carboxypeptidase/D-alanyl-D-alanine-endopeptidase [Deltaproteobacteria bacterium GWA2_38_16]OGQ01872.1 MAG: D-alanyl-D-alanine carboxypeptidase/D-alanyl-D-alanine-endopeptidase [Deltaproteobacteria bacterium RIFCSPHIGHO2_02_FULL_38_15]HBQ20773.1 D-alanyl-D-alanine carboxypeptidase/D-alanyl-D-alanine-endopeptidase [Deltaproteobacteria bacterium]